MSSLNTNVAAMTALQSLTATNKALTETQTRISSGLRVSSAADNAAYWSIATTMRSDNAALSTVQDALGLGASTIDVAYTALNSSIDITDKIKSKLIAARQPGVDRTKIQTEITELQNQLSGIAGSATLQGQNWLSVDSSAAGYNATKNIVSSISRTGSTISVQTIDINTNPMVLFDSSATASGVLDGKRDAVTGAISGTGTFDVSTLDISALTDSATDLATLDGYINGADKAISEMSAGATALGAAKSRISIQQDFVKNLMNAIDSGVGQLVDADMNEESTKLQALQVKQQLGIQALSIANSSSQSILRLFQ
jgi:flagellin